MISKFSLQYVILSSRKKYFFLQMNVCFKSLFSNQLEVACFKLSSPDGHTVVHQGVILRIALRQTLWLS